MLKRVTQQPSDWLLTRSDTTVCAKIKKIASTEKQINVLEWSETAEEGNRFQNRFVERTSCTCKKQQSRMY